MGNHPMVNLKAMPRFQLEQIKTPVQKTKRITQKPKEGKNSFIKQDLKLFSSRLWLRRPDPYISFRIKSKGVSVISIYLCDKVPRR